MAFSIMGWTAAYFMRSRGIAEDRAGVLLGLVGLMAILGAPLGGILADIWQRRNSRGRVYTAALADLLAAVVILSALLLEMKGAGFFLIVVWGILATMGLPSLSSISQDVITPGFKGMSWGMAMLCMYLLGGAWGPFIAGSISDVIGGGAAGLKTGLMVTSLGGIIGSIFFLISSRHYPVDMEKVKDISLKAE